MGSILNYVVDQDLIDKWTRRYGFIPKCQICKMEFKIGDHVEAKRSGKTNTRRYHEDCMESVPRPK